MLTAISIFALVLLAAVAIVVVLAVIKPHAFRMDRMAGKDFETGLSSLKALAERRAA